MICTAVTTICGVWLAYGEPPNLIMKANLDPHLDNEFFLVYCAPSRACRLPRRCVAASTPASRPAHRHRGMDVLDANVADVRFLQADRHGEVLTPVELVEGHAGPVGDAAASSPGFAAGEPLGLALMRENVPEPPRTLLLGHFVSEELADGLDRHYVLDAAGQYDDAFQAELAVDEVVARWPDDAGAQLIGGAGDDSLRRAAHRSTGSTTEIPLFLASFAGFPPRFQPSALIPRMRALALREARPIRGILLPVPAVRLDYPADGAGFFDRMQAGSRRPRSARPQSTSRSCSSWDRRCLSAILDNNIVADFASRGLPAST